MSYAKFYRKNCDSLHVIFLTSNLLGVSPFNPKMKYKYKTFPIIYSAVIVTWYSVQIILNIYLFTERNLSVPMIAVFVGSTCGSLVPILAILHALNDKDQTPKEAMDGLVFCDQCLHTVGVELDSRKVKKFIKCFFKFTSAYVVLFVSTVFITVILFNMTGFLAVTSVIVSLSQWIYTVFFTFFICSLVFSYKWRFQHLNEEVRTMIFSSLHTGCNVLKVKPFSMDHLRFINTIKFVHSIYRELVVRAGQRFTCLITLQLFQMQILVTLGVYMLLCAVLSGEIFKRDTIYCTIVLILSLSHYLFIILGLITCCMSKTSQEANKMEDIIHELMDETEDEKLLRELENFSLELIHGRLAFTGCDFFTIDYTLFTKITGAVVSYVIIFLQFGSTGYNEFFHFFRNENHSS